MKGSYLLLVSCGYCKTNIVKYQKVGKGNLLKMHIDRIIKGSIDFSKDLICPNCGKELGRKITLKKENKEVYKMKRSAFNTKKIDY